jgi:hypothetical protein
MNRDTALIAGGAFPIGWRRDDGFAQGVHAVLWLLIGLGGEPWPDLLWRPWRERRARRVYS